jgi:hypothetical protein
MQMGQAPGNLLYQARGFKLRRGYADLPADLRAFVEASYPEFQHAPTSFTPPNQTSWTDFRDLFESGAYSPACP